MTERRPDGPPEWLVGALHKLTATAPRALAPALVLGAFAADVLVSGTGLAGWLYAAGGLAALVTMIRALRSHVGVGWAARARPLVVHGALIAVVATGAPTRLAREWDFRMHEARRG